MKLRRATRNFINYCFVRIKRRLDYRLLSKLENYKKPYSDGWTYALYCLKTNSKLQKNQDATVPVSPLNHILYFKNLVFDINDIKNLQGCGKYFQCVGKITIGKGSYIANNVFLITSNHNFYDLTKHDIPRDISLGKYCWIGANSVILPGVVLGDRTIVGAGSIVTHSFPRGGGCYCR